MLIDVPGGWKYGWPRRLPDDVDVADGDALQAWLRTQGYDGTLAHVRYLCDGTETLPGMGEVDGDG